MRFFMKSGQGPASNAPTASHARIKAKWVEMAHLGRQRELAMKTKQWFSPEPGSPLVLFIASSSRSGSTLLDFMLGSHPMGVSAGEARRLQGFVLKDMELLSLDDENYPLTCSCGEPLERCPFWRQVEGFFGTPFREAAFKTRRKRAWRSLVMALYGALGPWCLRMLARSWPALRAEMEIGCNCIRLHRAISRVSGSLFVVDSSKSIYHYLLLHLAAPQAMRLIVLVRDGRAVAHSMVRGVRGGQWKKGSLHPFLQASRQWARTTRTIMLLSQRTPAPQRFLVRYEDICRDHMEVLRQVSEKWGLPPWEDPLEAPPREWHIIGGSPSVRFERAVRTVRADESWKQSIDHELAEAFERIAGSLNRKLGYHR